MKKLLLSVPVLVLCLSMCACTGVRKEYTSVMPEDAQVIDFSDSVTIVTSPTTAPTAAPTGVPAATPTPVTTGAAAPPAVSQTPAPAAAPTVSPVPSPKPTSNIVVTPKPSSVSSNPITKSPYSDVVEAGGTVKFVSAASNYSSVRWIIKSPDGTVSSSASDAPLIYDGLQVSGISSTTLVLSNVPSSMDGCQIQCVFHLNTDYYTNCAVLTVIGETVPSDPIAAVADACRNTYASYASGYGYSAGTITNYAVSGSVASFNVDFTNGIYLIRGEFIASSVSASPVSIYVYDSTGGSQLRYQAISTPEEFLSVLQNPVP